MKIQYENLDYQTDAVDAVVDLFADEFVSNVDDVGFSLSGGGHFGIVANQLLIDDDKLRHNLSAIQKRNLDRTDRKIDEQNLRDFSVEMETGTGKTYVYLKTVFALHQRYGLSKFIIIVPSVAVREGVLKTLRSTQSHFYKSFNTNLSVFAYEGESRRKISLLRDFSSSNELSILVMSIQAFNSDNNIINEDRRDDTQGKMIEFIAQTQPVLVLDEPQNMESDLSKSALNKLNAIFKLRYSATHKNLYNLVYSLSPFTAYNKGLVKKIEIASVVKEDANSFTFEIVKLDFNKQASAKIKVEVKQKTGEYIFKTLLFKLGSSVFQKTKNDKYKDLYIEKISEKGVELTGGVFYSVTEVKSADKVDIFRVQIRETIKNHFAKQKQLGTEIKVLSLFFIDKVKNYVADEGLIKQIFEAEFEALKSTSDFFKNKQAQQVHNGYFSKTGKNYKDTKGNSKSDKATYDLIMKDKERLLSFSEDTCFIFSHSALKEGWDNPNIFTICTLNETLSVMKKRQEIGRGMRLCLDKNGTRIYDSSINKLVVVPNESYQDYVSTLQTEFDESGQRGITPPSKKNRTIVKFKKQFATNDANFKILWKRIKHKTKYDVQLNSDDLVIKIVKNIDEQLEIKPPMIKIERQNLVMEGDKIQGIYSSENVGSRISKQYQIQNLTTALEVETGLTKATILRVLKGIDCLNSVFDNPQDFIRGVALIIKHTLKDELLNGIQYHEVDDCWNMSLFNDIETYEDKIVPSDKSIYDYSVFDSEGEKKFAQSLDASVNVKVFAKMPPWFVVDTPIGTYNPDWAIVWQGNEQEKLYLVRESKFVNDLQDLRESEKYKNSCAAKHFKAINADFKVVIDTQLNDLIESI
ncbi:Type III restriction enzyme, res subunit:DEAD/DEAH box helicase, N-terminal [uncultured Candidatus Thioglobus sp.]|nr:Type III restriction enzyme, res subunit:DEAD/DEAH box helicase, N-terminal [uncultured Candidatus Thioglobus sp.]